MKISLTFHGKNHEQVLESVLDVIQGTQQRLDYEEEAVAR